MTSNDAAELGLFQRYLARLAELKEELPGVRREELARQAYCEVYGEILYEVELDK